MLRTSDLPPTRVFRPYEWQMDATKESRLRLGKNLRDGSEYKIVDRPGLFAKFAQLEPSEEAILGFASRNGHLSGPPDSDGVFEEHLASWRFSIGKAKAALDLWHAMLADDAQSLPSAIEFWFDDAKSDWWLRPLLWPRTDAQSSSSGWTLFDELPKPTRRRNYFQTVRLISASEEFSKCAKRVLVNIVARQLEYVWPRTEPMGLIDKNGGFRFLWPVKSTLLLSLWLQFAEELSTETQYSECVSCGNLFPVSQAGYRADRVYCSTTCQGRVYRHRKRQARKMRAEGASLRQITKELSSNLATVKSWVAGVRKA